MNSDHSTASRLPGAMGDGVHDDTAAIQAALDSGARTVHLPAPPSRYLISKTLRLHSGQTLQADRSTVIRLADHAHVHMLTNADHDGGNAMITITGGVWDGNNARQTCEYHQGVDGHAPYDPARYLGVIMQFNRVVDLRVAHVTLKDPETFGLQAGNLRRFTIEDITFDYNMLRLNMDGVHLHGNCRQGRIANLKGATNDDMVALNADDGSMFEMSRGPIEDIEVDGLWADNGYTAIRLLSAGSPVRRVRLRNIFGTYRYYAVSFTHHNVHPGEPTTFDDVLIDGVFCSKPVKPLERPLSGDEWGRHQCPLIWLAGGVRVRNLHLLNLFRDEWLPAAPPSVHVEKGATVEHLSIRGVSHINHAATPLDFLVNDGAVGVLFVADVSARAEGGEPRGRLLANRGTIRRQELAAVSMDNLAP